MMKALVTTLAFGGAVAATAVIISIQRNPHAFTNADRELIGQDIPVQVVPVSLPSTVEETPAQTATSVVTIEEVKVLARPMRRWRAAAPAAQAEPDLVIPKIVPAPCVQGEYRKLDEHRGVYLTCPGQTE